MEGSSYEGFMVKDSVWFDEHYLSESDEFDFVFGCVSKETRLFYTQKADGILGMGRSHAHSIS